MVEKTRGIEGLDVFRPPLHQSQRGRDYGFERKKGKISGTFEKRMEAISTKEVGAVRRAQDTEQTSGWITCLQLLPPEPNDNRSVPAIDASIRRRTMRRRSW